MWEEMRREERRRDDGSEDKISTNVKVAGSAKVTLWAFLAFLQIGDRGGFIAGMYQITLR